MIPCQGTWDSGSQNPSPLPDSDTSCQGIWAFLWGPNGTYTGLPFFRVPTMAGDTVTILLEGRRFAITVPVSAVCITPDAALYQHGTTEYHLVRLGPGLYRGVPLAAMEVSAEQWNAFHAARNLGADHKSFGVDDTTAAFIRAHYGELYAVHGELREEPSGPVAVLCSSSGERGYSLDGRKTRRVDSVVYGSSLKKKRRMPIVLR